MAAGTATERTTVIMYDSSEREMVRLAARKE
jgi:hypothetical protein